MGKYLLVSERSGNNYGGTKTRNNYQALGPKPESILCPKAKKKKMSNYIQWAVLAVCILDKWSHVISPEKEMIEKKRREGKEKGKGKERSNTFLWVQ